MLSMKYIACLFSIMMLVLTACNDTVTSNDKPVVSAGIDGEQLFKINCSQCHKPDQDYTGPALHAAVSRWKDKAMLYEFVRNSQDIIAKDAYAKELFKKWNNTFMQPYPDLSNEQIEAILKYCNSHDQ